ncbi:S8 family peptidase [Paenibacillus sp.]|uniref:S8 family peptidase n=1 Tax=Paenibacillus sp. TaxID=58172 RepID=UPI002811EE37|nr:S8 family peptidase [Paenibacillus sp.]
MEAVAFVKMLHQALTRPKRRESGRHILRVANAADYHRIAKTIQETKGVFRRLASVRPLPLIHAFSYNGALNPAFLRKFAGLVTIEDDVAVSVHALPAHGAGSPVPPGRIKRPFVPSGIRTVRVPAVWKHSRGDRVKIGVIDTGVDYNHPDLQPALSRGINLVHPRTLPYDDNGHGTHIAGTIAAAGRFAMTGIAPHAVLLPVKAFDHEGSAYVSDIIKGIDWCVHQGVHIINMSFGMKQRSESMLEAVRNAKRSGVIIVASSGNDGRRGFIDYPARFPQTISVGAVDAKGAIAPFSNRGKRIDVFAPGEKVMSTWPKGRYHEMNGTSMATAHVTGVLALAMAARPGLTPTQAKRLIAAAQVPLKLPKKATRYPGRLDAVRAFRHLKG